MLGQTVGGRYQIIRYLGGGGFGRTYLAEDWHLPGKPQCVVKQLNPKSKDEKSLQTARRLFDREAEVLHALGQHEQIPRIFAHFEENQEFYLVQEFIDGEVLSSRIKKRELASEEQVIPLLMDILTTLEFVHREQVIHRDIKPSNLILRRSDHKIVLIDFGAVKHLGHDEFTGEEEETSSLTIAVGSSGYMPNEQLAGKPRYNSDLYALGMVALRALTGLSPAQMVDDPRTGEIVWRDKVDISEELADIIDKMIRYDHRHRYQSASEALADLRRLIPPDQASITIPLMRSVDLDSQRIWIERGDELFNQQRHREAIACYDKALQAIPDEYMVWFKRSMALENLHAYDEAVESYDRVLQIQPDDYLAWFKRGKALEHLQRHEEASHCYDRVIEIQPDNYWAWHDKGRVLEAAQSLEEAVAAYDRAVQIKHDFTLAVESRKRVLSQLKQVDQLYGLQHYDEAVVSCDRAIQANPTDPLPWLMRGMALENMEQYEEAVKSYDKVVQLNPEDHLAWFKRGTVLEKLKRHRDAVLSYNKVVQLQPENYWAWNDRGRVLETMQHYEMALASYDKAVQLKPDFQAALEGRRRSLRYLRHGKPGKESPKKQTEAVVATASR
jgi:serine/threonine protein kinase/exonuclease VII small subunit